MQCETLPESVRKRFSKLISCFSCFSFLLRAPEELGDLGTGPDDFGVGPDVFVTGPDVLGNGPNGLGTGPDDFGVGLDVLWTDSSRMEDFARKFQLRK